MTEWRLVGGIVPECSPVSVGGLSPWEHEWKRVDESAISATHPQYSHQRHTMQAYEMSDGEITVRFAAGEFSNAAWGFHLPQVRRKNPRTTG